MENTSERELLALLITHPNLIEKTYVKEEYFSDKNKLMFQIIIKEYNRAKSLVLDNLAKYRNFDIDHFIELLNNNIYSSSKDMALIQLQKNIIDNYKTSHSKEVIEQLKDKPQELLLELQKINDIDYHEIEYLDVKTMHEHLAKNGKRVSTGYPKLDKAINLCEHDLLILGGGTGTGKTTFALNILNRMSRNYNCFYFNMEMSPTIITKRLLSMNTGIELIEFNDYTKLSDDRVNIIKSKMQEIEDRKIVLLSKSYSAIDIRKEVASVNCDSHFIIFIDHIGLVKSQGKSIYEKTTYAIQELRRIALDFNCTIICLAQLSRDVQRSGAEPRLQDLRDSGEIEQSARKVIMLHNKTNDDTQRHHSVDIIVAKNDNGSKPVIEYDFDRYIQRFIEKE